MEKQEKSTFYSNTNTILTLISFFHQKNIFLVSLIRNFVKPVLFKNPNPERSSDAASSFYLQEDLEKYFYDILHYHPEYQLTVIYKGEGTLFVGDRIDRFEPGDVFLFGPNLPHVLRCDPSYYEDESELESFGISLYFRLDSFGPDFFDLPETENIKGLLSRSATGLRFTGIGLDRIRMAMKEMKNLQGMKRLLSLFTMMENLAKEVEVHSSAISGIHYTNPLKETDSKRINATFEYVMNNFKEEISLNDVADIANMSPSSFSRFFRQRTRKTFSRFVNEVRIGNACQLLRKADCTIYESAYSSGYNNLSNFNRQFKLITGHSPREYIRKING